MKTGLSAVAKPGGLKDNLGDDMFCYDWICFRSVVCGLVVKKTFVSCADDGFVRRKRFLDNWRCAAGVG